MKLGIEAGKNTIDIAVKYQVRGVPISAEDLIRKGADAACAELNAANLRVCQVGAFGYNPLHPDRAVRAGQQTMLLDAIPIVAQTGCRHIVICGGSYHPNAFSGVDRRNFTSAALEEVARELEPVLRAATDHDAIISVEPYLKTAVGSADAFVRLARLCGSDHLRVNLDVTSLYDFSALVDPDQLVADACAKLAPYIGLVHVKEVALADGFHIHAGLCPLSEGKTNWRRMFEMVGKDIPEESWVILEHVQTEEEAGASLRLLRRAIEDAGMQWS